MITVEIHRKRKHFSEEGANLPDESFIHSFTVSGHAGAGVAGEDIVCAAVSSAAYLTANTLMLYKGANVHADVRDGYMSVSLHGDVILPSPVLEGFLMHIVQMQTQYPDRVHLTITEV